MILCDTNIIIEFLKGNSAIVAELQQIGQENLGISVISEAELYFGAFDKAELRYIKRCLSGINVLPVDMLVSELFIQLMESYALSHRLSIPDALIGATAITQGIELYTLNIKDFRYMPDIKLYQPG